MPSGEHSRETALSQLLAAAVGDLEKYGASAVEVLRLMGDLGPAAYCDAFDCHAAPWFTDHVAAFQAWYEAAQAYAGV